MAIRVLLVDDHALVRRGLHFFLSTQPDIKLVGEAGDGQEALQQVAKLRPDVVLMDLVMPGMDGIEATQQIRNQYPDVQVIMLTSFSEQDQVMPAIRAGAVGYLLKDVQPDELVSAIRGAHQGQAQLHPKVANQLMAALAGPAPAAAPVPAPVPRDALTTREEDVLRLIAQGKSNKEIAVALHIAEKTVKTHVSNILSKLGLADRTQAAIYAVKQGLAEQ